MNDRIRELAKQAHEDTLSAYRQRMRTEFAGDVIFADMYDQKFAESIVRECVSCCGSQADKNNLLKHFDLPVDSNVQYDAPPVHNSVTSQYTRKYNIP